MKIFSRLYDWTMDGARHRHASYYLYGLSFAEASFFPVPPDVILAPMALAKPERAWHYAGWTTVFSVVGGIFGYILGMFFIGLIHPYLRQFGYESTYQTAMNLFSRYGFWMIFVAGFSPIPYKLFTLAAGVMHMSLPLFVLASLVGRGARFFLVAGFMRWGGAKVERLLRTYVDRLGWLVVGLVMGGISIFMVTGCTSGKKPLAPVTDLRSLGAVSRPVVVVPPVQNTIPSQPMRFHWPLQGAVLANFAQGNRKFNKGIDIAARPGEPVLASASGKVVYSGRGLRGYGELVILKHADDFLSAYAHNQRRLVKEGDAVQAGQTIALAGDSDASRPMLHFQIRKQGKPVDPALYLPPRD